MRPNIFAFLATTLLISAGCGPEKGKPDLSTDGKTFEAALRTPGDWQLLQTVESAHPTTHDFERLWQVNGDAGATEMLVELVRFELESGYDYLYVSDAGGAQLTENTGNRTGTELVVRGNSVELYLRTDESVSGWGFRANVYQRQSCACQAIHQPVCGVDGTTYGNSCRARCAGVSIAYQSACNGSPWASLPVLVESPHDYTNGLNRTWTITEGGARYVRLHFPRIDVERGYDFVVVQDGAGNTVARYTGAGQDITTPEIEGGTAVVQLVTDGSVVRWGFAVDRYDVIGGCATDADCASGETCNTNIQCIRAPCFNLCESPNAGYTDVTVAELETNRSSWTGQKVRVVAEPNAHGAACTRRACSQANPCCNTCSGSLTIGNGIALFDANDQPMGCRGNECNWQDTCDPFPAQDGGEYEIRGVFTMDAVGQDRLLIDDFRAAGCRQTGCSGSVCANNDVITTCVVQPEHACYANASCLAQADGHCGFTQTPELLACIDNARSARYGATDVPLSIPDNDPRGVTSRIDVPAAGSITEVLVSVDIRHTYRGDLIVRLNAPSGESFLLHNGEGGSNRDLVFSDRAVAAGGLERSGAWTLHVVDRYARDLGTLDGWALAFR
jgi:hypothetical protein